MSSRLHLNVFTGLIRNHRNGPLLIVVIGLLSTIYLVTLMLQPTPTSGGWSTRSHSCQLPLSSSLSTADGSTSLRIQSARKDSFSSSDDDVSRRLPASSMDARNVAIDASRPLDDNFAPSTIFFVWCAPRYRKFEFRHNAAIRSAISVLRPDSVWFYYGLEPVVDRWSYGTWLDELSAEFPFFARRPVLELGQLDACNDDRPSVDFIVWLISTHGGFYVDLNTILVDFSPELRSHDVFVAYGVAGQTDDGIQSAGSDSRNRVRVLMAKSGQLCVVGSPDDGYPSRRTVLATNCLAAGSDITQTKSRKASPVCIEAPKSLQPRLLMTADGDDVIGRVLGSFLRTVIYGNPELPKPVADYEKPMPKIGHVIWIGGGTMKFSFFLTVLSLLHCAKLDVAYVHGNRPPAGRYWKLLLASQAGRVKFARREDMKLVYGSSVSSVSHESDVWRADILYKYGGVYIDADAVMVQPLSDELRAYEAVVSYDWPQWYPPFPDIFNLGVSTGKPGSRFWQLCLESMKSFRDQDFTWNGLRQPYRVFERHPDLVRVDPRLQVICFELRCHPTWWPDYHNEAVNHMNPPAGVAPLDWRSDTFSFHFTYPMPEELSNPTTLLSATGMFAEIGQHVLQKSGLTNFFRSNWTDV